MYYKIPIDPTPSLKLSSDVGAGQLMPALQACRDGFSCPARTSFESLSHDVGSVELVIHVMAFFYKYRS